MISIFIMISLLYFFVFLAVMKIEKRKDIINRIYRNTPYPIEEKTKKKSGKIQDWVLKNALGLRPKDFFLFSFIAVSVIFTVSVLLKINLLLSLFITVMFFAAFLNIFKILSHRKNYKKEKQLEHFLIDLIGNLYANPNILNGIENTLKETDQPLKSEFEKVVDDTRRGMLLRESLLDAVKRNDSRLIEIVITSLVIADDKGVDVIGFLKDQVEYIRHRKALENYIKILSSGPRYTSYIIGAIPLLAIVIILLINKNFLNLYLSGIGMVLMGYCLLSYLMGFLIINKMTNFINKNRLFK